MKKAPQTAAKTAVTKKTKASSIEDVISIETDTGTLTASVVEIDPSECSVEECEQLLAALGITI